MDLWWIWILWYWTLELYICIVKRGALQLSKTCTAPIRHRWSNPSLSMSHFWVWKIIAICWAGGFVDCRGCFHTYFLGSNPFDHNLYITIWEGTCLGLQQSLIRGFLPAISACTAERLETQEGVNPGLSNRGETEQSARHKGMEATNLKWGVKDLEMFINRLCNANVILRKWWSISELWKYARPRQPSVTKTTI